MVKEERDPAIPQIKGPGLGLPDFLKKRAAMPKEVDPMADAFAQRTKAGDIKKADPKAKKPVEEVFKLKQTAADSSPQRAPKAVKPPKAVYVKRNRDELYQHTLNQKPFNWFH